MEILEKKILLEPKQTDVKYLVLVGNNSGKFNVAKVPYNLDLTKAHYFFPIMVDEKRARERYNLR